MTFESPALFGDATPDAVACYPVSEESNNKGFMNIKKKPTVYLKNQKSDLKGVVNL